MATSKVDNAWTPVTAGQHTEFWLLSETQGSHVNKTSFQLYLEGKNPFPKPWVERFGRIYLEVKTLGLTAEEWRDRITKSGYKINSSEYNILNYGYNNKHRYEAGKTLKVVLIRGKDVQDSERKTENLKAIAAKDFGEASVSQLKGELILLIREILTNEDLEQLNIHYIGVFNVTEGEVDKHITFFSDRRGSVGAYFDKKSISWDEKGAFGFLL